MHTAIKYSLLGMLLLSALVFHGCEKESKLPVDGDGNVYDTVRIGTQTWLAEDLKTTKYNNGVSIPLVTDNTQWASMSSAAFCWYGNNPAFKENYGALYNWYAAKVSFLCPAGYHVPSKEEWQTLIDYLGGEEIAGDKLKAAGTQFWSSGNYSTNESRFTAMPGGNRSHNEGTFNDIRSRGSWWSTSSWSYDNYAYLLRMDYNYSSAKTAVWFKKAGFSVRCIKDD